MNLMISKRFLSVSIALLTLTVAPSTAHAQTMLPITVTVMVPVQVQDVDPSVVTIRVTCSAQPVNSSVGVTFDFHHLSADAGPVANGAYTGTAKVVLSGWSTQPLTPGQQWTYQCHASFLTAHTKADGVQESGTPGVDSWAALAPTSGPNLVQGTFTTQ